MVSSRLAAFLPTASQWIVAGPPLLAWAACALAFAAWLKQRWGVSTPYTRKLFHFLVFFTAALLHAATGLRIVCVFGSAVTAVLALAIVRGPGHPLYEAIARESDAPRRTRYVVVPYLATVVGGLASNGLFGDTALVGYAVTGIGDAVGEPVGARFGRHRYRVPALGGGFTRSLEGSAAVFLASGAAAFAALASLGAEAPAASLAAAGAIAAAATTIEAACPHGWDNAPLMLVPSLLAWWWR